MVMAIEAISDGQRMIGCFAIGEGYAAKEFFGFYLPNHSGHWG
jgi:hypothetical protein